MFNLLAGVLPSRRSEAHRGLPEAHRGRPRPGLGRKTYWHEDKARLTGTRIYIILLLESHGNGDGVAVGNCGAL